MPNPDLDQPRHGTLLLTVESCGFLVVEHSDNSVAMYVRSDRTFSDATVVGNTGDDEPIPYDM